MNPDTSPNPSTPNPGTFAWRWFNGLSLRGKTLLVGVGRLVALMLILGFGIQYLALEGFGKVEQQYLQDNVDRVNQVFTQSARNLERYVHDYAVWDDSYQFIVHPLPKFVEDNFSQEVLANLRISHALILDRNLKLVAGRSLVSDAVTSSDIDPALVRLLAPMASGLFKSGKISTAGLLEVDGEIYIVAACQVYPTQLPRPSLGAFFHLKHVDKVLVQEYSGILRVPLEVTPILSPAPSQGKDPEPAFMVLDQTSDLLRVGIPLKDPDNRTIGIVEASLPRGIQRQARQFILLVHLALGVVLVATTLLWPLTMRWLVLGRLEQIHAFLAMLGRKRTLAERLPAREGDELDALAIGINQTLDALESAQQHRDESERGLQRLQEQLIKIQKVEALATMAGGVAHDFNNSLSAIMGSLELMQEELPPEHPSQKHIVRMKKAGSSACALAKQMLNLSRTGSVQKAPIHLGDAVSDVLRLVRAGLPKSIEIRFLNEAFDDVVLAEATQLQQVIMNLATNASHAMANQPLGCIEVSIHESRLPDATDHPETLMLPPGEYLRLDFSDNGHGIPAEIVGKVFDPFFTTKPPGSGTGLGLAVAQGFVARHEGSLGLQSVVGQGTTFTIHLPKHRGVQQGARAGKGQALRILLVDDDTHGRETLADGFRRLGHTVTETSNGMSGLRLVEEDPRAFDAVVTDQIMPGMTGLDLGERLLRSAPGLPVFLISGYTGPVEAKSLREKGIASLFMKPVVLAELERAIQEAHPPPGEPEPSASGSGGS